jgi:miniconductance mechanosensitive channel
MNIQKKFDELVAIPQNLFAEYPLLETSFWLTSIVVSAIIVNVFVKVVLVRLLNRFISNLKFVDGKEIADARIVNRIAIIVPSALVAGSIGLVPHLPLAFMVLIRNVSNAITILVVGVAILHALSLFEKIWHRKHQDDGKSVKLYLQVLRLVVYLVTAILTISAVIDRSPMILLSGIGAVAAVFVIVFQDTLLSITASLQISSSKMVKVGDWIEMPQHNANGEITDITLQNIRVRNWDNTVSTISTRKLVSEPFTNHQPMRESGGRRLTRSVFIDQNTIRFMREKEIIELYAITSMKGFLDAKSDEMKEIMKSIGADDKESDLFGRITNLSAFRHYMKAYLQSHPRVRNDMHMMIRQLQPTAEGIPVEIYCFVDSVEWSPYEEIVSSIFEHLFGILTKFGLGVFQNPSGTILDSNGQIKRPIAELKDDSLEY